MDRRLFPELVLITVLAGIFALTFGIQGVKASWTIYIRTDESRTGTALLRQLAVAYTLSLGSREDCYCTSNRGTIVFDGVAYSLPRPISKEAWSYSIRYDAGSGYEFSRWETSGEASIMDYYNSSTTVIVNGNGTVVAIYTRTVASYIVNLDSLENTLVTSNLGNITLGGVTYSLPSWPSKTLGTHPIQFNVPSGYEFDHWETIGGLTMTNVNAQSTWVVVSGNGYATGVYRKSIPQFRVYDLALIGIDIPNNSVIQGQMLPINVTVMNEGTNDEVCNLTMYANDTEFCSVQQMLTHGETRTISLDWNTSGLLGNYTLRAYVRLLAGELHIDDNDLICQPAITIEKAYMTTDLNKDGTINIQDITIVAIAYGSDLGDPNWNAVADLDKNGIINIVDVTMVAKDYGKTV